MSGRHGLFSTVLAVWAAAAFGCTGQSAAPYPAMAPHPGPPGLSPWPTPAETGGVILEPEAEVKTFTPGTTVVVTTEPQQPPPPLKVVIVKPARPGPAYVWREGYWVWRSGRYVWVPGAWAVPPPRAKRWVPGQWKRTRRGYVHVPGRWR